MTRQIPGAATTHGFTRAFLVAPGIAAAGFVISLVAIDVRRNSLADPEAARAVHQARPAEATVLRPSSPPR